MASHMSPMTPQPGKYAQIHDEKGGQYQYPIPPQPPYPVVQLAYPVMQHPQPEGNHDHSVSIKRTLVRLFLAASTILFLAVVGLSAGLGVSQHSLQQTQTNLNVVQQSMSAMALSPATTTVYIKKDQKTKTSSATAAAATAPITASDVQCPTINGTTFTATVTSNSTSAAPTDPSPTKLFLLLCGLDYGEGEATDIGNAKVKSLSECAEACARKKGCTGAGWGVMKGDKGPEHTCWMKSDLIKSHNATGEWGFAKLLG